MNYSYYAFISYSRRDKAAARYLQNKLENYRYPGSLVPDGRKPENPKYLRKVFRDTSDLDVTQDNFTASIDKHIADSRYLVVLCSSNSAKSPWVEREIVKFLETHDNDLSSIVPVILEGDVPACLPPLLNRPEFINRNIPTMIPDDASSQKEGWEHGFLQIVGCLLDVSIAKITDRFQKARQAMLRRIIFGTLAALMITVGLTIWALVAEKKAKIAEAKAVHEAEIASHALQFIKTAFASADASKSGDKDITLLKFAQQTAPAISDIPIFEVKLEIAQILIPLLNNMGDSKLALNTIVKIAPVALQSLQSDSCDRANFEMVFGSVLFSNGKYKEALTHYQNSLEYFSRQQNKDNVKIAHLYNQIGSTYRRMADYNHAIESFLWVISNINAEDSNRDVQFELAEALGNLGSTYRDKGEYAKALTYYPKALEIRKKLFGPTNNHVAHTYHAMGLTYRKMKNYPVAEENIQKALNIYIQDFGENHPYVADAYGDLGEIFRLTKNYERAEEFYIRALKIRKSKYGEQHPAVADSYNSLGNIAFLNKSYDVAETNFIKALEIRKIIFGEKHPDVAQSYNNLGAVASLRGDKIKAIEYYRKSLNIRIAILGEMNPDPELITTYKNLASTYTAVGDYANALELAVKVKKIDENSFGKNHLTVADDFMRLGNIYEKKKDFYNALDAYNNALQIRQKELGKNDLLVAGTYSRLSVVYRLLSNLEKSIDCTRKANNIRSAVKKSSAISPKTTSNSLEKKNNIEQKEKILQEKIAIFGVNHIEVAQAYKMLAKAYLQTEEYSKSLENQTKAKIIFEQGYGQYHLSVADSWMDIGYIYIREKKFEMALEAFEKALAIRQKQLGEFHKSVDAAYRSMGLAYKELKQYDKSEECYLKVLEIQEKISGENSNAACGVYHSLGQLMATACNYQKAIKYYQKALDIKMSLSGDMAPGTAISYGNLAIQYINIDDFDHAMELAMKSKDIREKTLGKDHSAMAISWSIIGNIYLAKKDFNNALIASQNALKIREEKLGKEHPDTASTYSSLGRVYRELSQFDKSADYYQIALAIEKQKYGNVHKSVAGTMSGLGRTLGFQGKFDEGLRLLQEGERIRISLLREKHPDVAESWFYIGTLYAQRYNKSHQEKDKENAKLYLKKSYDLRKQIFGDTHSKTKEVRLLLNELN